MWEVAKPLIPPARVRPQGGGVANIDDEAVFAAIIYVPVYTAADPTVSYRSWTASRQALYANWRASAAVPGSVGSRRRLPGADLGIDEYGKHR
ncbi:hypothetical protein [Streptomyces nigrescens]|uniref:hypothetical protein n=1 Tax=Streptomyces nigrescens TaxID=1920 RepID=UPI0039659E51